MIQVFLILGTLFIIAFLIGMKMYLKHREKMNLSETKGEKK